jgi:transcriptional regulator with XRE-family HTH domain
VFSRFKELLDQLGLSPSTFAERIGVQRSSVSHILSGRNKPSVDFLEKILHAFPRVNVEWLITGKGNWDKGAQEGPAAFEKDDHPSPGQHDTRSLEHMPEVGDNKKPAHAIAGPVDHIIIVYRDNSFRMLDPAGGKD